MKFARKKFLRSIVVLTAVSWVSAIALPASAQESAVAPDVARLLKSSDRARGGGFPGLVWEVASHSKGTGMDDQEDQTLRVKASDNANGVSSVAEVLLPVSSKGAKMLQVGRNMWITKPGLRKPVAISPRQRLTGQASIGDIAATDYTRNYTPTLLREEKLDGEDCAVLDLKAKNSQSTYDRITYWISVKRGIGMKAEFMSLSGKVIKTATFDYGNAIKVDGRTIPFLSRMMIRDALTDASTVLTYSHIEVRPVSTIEFDVENLR